MTKHYVTFGFGHTHSIVGRALDKDCVARFDAPDAETGRRIAFDLFGPVFCFEYHGKEWEEDEAHNMSYYPRGYVDIALCPAYRRDIDKDTKDG